MVETRVTAESQAGRTIYVIRQIESAQTRPPAASVTPERRRNCPRSTSTALDRREPRAGRDFDLGRPTRTSSGSRLRPRSTHANIERVSTSTSVDHRRTRSATTSRSVESRKLRGSHDFELARVTRTSSHPRCRPRSIGPRTDPRSIRRRRSVPGITQARLRCGSTEAGVATLQSRSWSTKVDRVDSATTRPLVRNRWIVH